MKKLSNSNIENVFNSFAFGLLGMYVFFNFLVFLCMFLYADFGSFFTILFNKSTFFSIYLSIVTSTITTILSLLFGIPTGYILSRYRFKGKFLIDLIIKLPITLPPLVAGLGLLILFQTDIGMYLANHGLKFVFTVKGIVLAQFFISASFATITFRSTFDEIESKNELVARTLGCNKLKAFTFVTLPDARYGIASGVILTWSRAIGEFVPILLFCGAMAGKTDILPIAIFLKIETGSLNEALVLTFIFIILCVIILPLSNLFTQRQREITSQN